MHARRGAEAFVAGTDIEQFQDFRDGEDGVAYEARIDAGIAAVEALPMPTVAVVEGWAVGGGLAIATACDFRIATPAARVSGCRSPARSAIACRWPTWRRLVAAFGRPRAQAHADAARKC